MTAAQKWQFPQTPPRTRPLHSTFALWFGEKMGPRDPGSGRPPGPWADGRPRLAFLAEHSALSGVHPGSSRGAQAARLQVPEAPRHPPATRLDPTGRPSTGWTHGHRLPTHVFSHRPHGRLAVPGRNPTGGAELRCGWPRGRAVGNSTEGPARSRPQGQQRGGGRITKRRPPRAGALTWPREPPGSGRRRGLAAGTATLPSSLRPGQPRREQGRRPGARPAAGSPRRTGRRPGRLHCSGEQPRASGRRRRGWARPPRSPGSDGRGGARRRAGARASVCARLGAARDSERERPWGPRLLHPGSRLVGATR